ncbi:hypothetical protein RhiirA5_438187 [Rhizophagus irregularis]|uniref:Uncharacterized protein n=1 Tax=Rhizophagus irregularis TaxID=588596 RepID=A0A2N0NJG5_9GLOM|nr:hypothetical protein RhiirA5_438187 [Rhizophagus irregularis]PKC57965.1 hypothetical protein RhiirA1_471678 [Rhizophagus irregularis]
MAHIDGILNDENKLKIPGLTVEYFIRNNTLLKHIKKAEQILQNTILNEYDEPLEKAIKDNFVDLDSILFVPSYQGNYKFQ